MGEKKCIECSGRVEKWCITTSAKYSCEQGDNKSIFGTYADAFIGPRSSYEDIAVLTIKLQDVFSFL